MEKKKQSILGNKKYLGNSGKSVDQAFLFTHLHFSKEKTTKELGQAKIASRELYQRS